MHSHCHAGRQPLAGQRVIEVGAGVGIVGLTAAALGAQVVLTDLVAVLPGLWQNIQVQCKRLHPCIFARNGVLSVMLCVLSDINKARRGVAGVLDRRTISWVTAPRQQSCSGDALLTTCSHPLTWSWHQTWRTTATPCQPC